MAETEIDLILAESPRDGDFALSTASKADRDFSDLLERGLGLGAAPHTLDAFTEACRARANALGVLESDYVRILSSGGPAARAEWMAVAPAIVVGETFLFRDAQLWQLVETTLMPGLAALGGPVWMWSAGCSTGEEAYTLALLAHRAFGPEGYRVIGTDINPKAIAAARVGVYGQWSLRGVSPVRRVTLCAGGAQTVRVPEDVKSLVRFETHNLNDAANYPPNGMGLFELIVCRNVLIYMTQAAREAIVQRLAACVSPGGVLILGHGEAAGFAVGDLIPERYDAGVVFRKPAVSAVRIAPPAVPPRKPKTERAHDRKHIARAPQPAHVAAEIAHKPTPDKNRCRLLLAEAMAAAKAGKMEEAERHATAAIAAEPIDPEPHVLAGALLMARGALREAETELRRALFLDPVFVPALWQVGNLYGMTNRKRQAIFAFARALAQLEGAPAEAEALPFDHLTVGELTTLLRAEIGEHVDA
ncbi:MAG TPA: CheR family methyltransferase [Candidatus Eremiobacteraceae bacterium]|nr:CheR family methyltransferase [Candidatus Eremiobacteraceae bacterium]